MSRFKKFAMLLVLLFFAAFAVAQTNTARLSGTVSDSAGAVVSGATVTVTNAGTGRAVTANTDEAGNYVIPALPPSEYHVEVKQSGFKSVTQTVTLQTQQVAVLNLVLQVGQVTENVTVTTDLPVIETGSSNISDVVVGRQITELPLNGRNFTQLATLVPGVTRGVQQGQASGAGNQAETFRYGNTGGASLSVNGLRPQNNNFILDGIDNNESLVNTVIFFPPAESIQEFRVDTSVAPSEFGRAGGGVVNTSFKSGTNQYHGTAFWFLRNDNLDATPYFNTSKPEFKRHQFGGSIGGPIIKDKLFVFGDYQGLRQYLPLPQDRATVPTDLMRQGNFSELLQLAAPIQIKDPITGLPLVGNLIPSAEIIAPGQNYLNAFPEPNIPGSSDRCGQVNLDGVCIKQNYLAQRTQIQNFDDFDVRVDYNLSSRDLVFGRYSYGRDKSDTSSRLPALPAGFGSGLQANYPRSFAFGETHTFSPNIVNEFRFGWIKTEFGYTPPFNNVPLSADLGIPNANTLSILGGGALIGGFNDQLEYTGDFGPYQVPEQTWQFSDSVSYIHGKHSLKFGAQILRRQVNLFRPFSGKGFFFLFGNGGGDSPTGYEVSDVLAGWVNQYSVGPTLGFSHTRNWETGYFVQDDWKVNQKLTLNLGLRYDLYTWPEEKDNLQANFDVATGQIVLPGTNGYPKALIDTDKNNFAPRVGFAYDLFSSGKSVLRGGFGVFYFMDRGGIDNQLAQNAPFSGQSQINFSDGVRINLQGRAPDGSSDPTLAGSVDMPSKGPLDVDLTHPTGLSLVSYPKDSQNSSAYQWNLQYQQELGANMGLSVGYVASRGLHLTTLLNLNRQFYDAPSGTKLFPDLSNINWNGYIGRSYYDSMQVQLQRRLVNGLQYSLAYTWSHTIDNSPGTLDQQSDRVDFDRLFAERANSNLDVRHRFVATAIYELPFGRGKRMGSDWNGFLDAVAGGWQVNPILTFQTGLPFDLIDQSGPQPVTRPDQIGSLHQLDHIAKWFDTSAFASGPSTAGIFDRAGTAPRNPFHGPGRQYLDFSLFKNFRIGERLNTQFRAQFYNITNTPQFDQPNGNVGSGDFGRVTNTLLSTERQIEFALRFTF